MLLLHSFPLYYYERYVLRMLCPCLELFPYQDTFNIVHTVWQPQFI